MAEGEWHRLIALLDDGDKFVRRKALKNLSVIYVDNVKVDFHLVVDAVLRTACRDSVGSLREEAVTVLQRIVEKFPRVESGKLSDVLKVVSERMGVDGCEEVRLQFVRLARSCVVTMSGCDDWMLANLEPVTVFVKAALTDCYGEVAREGCECVVELAGSNPHFGLQSEFFVEPLLAGARNYNIKVRVSCIKALEPVLICSFLLVPNIVSRLEELYLEDNPQLRLAIVAMIGRVLVRLGVREQNCYLLLPFLFVAACDDFPQVSKSAENTLSELKAQENGTTANSWCTYVCDVFEKLLPNMSRQTEQWKIELRIQAAQLIYVFIRELSSKAARHVEALVDTISFQLGDDEAAVCCWAEKSADMLSQSLADEALRFLAKRTLVQTDIRILRSLLHSNTINTAISIRLLEDLCESSKESDLVMDCTRLMLLQDLPEPVLHQLLSTVLIARRGTDLQPPSQADDILCQISACLGHSDMQAMLRARFASIMSAFDAGCPSTWTADSKSWRVLVSVADRLDVLDAGVTKTICSVVSATGQPEMRLKCFQMLAALVQRAELVDCEILATVLDVMVDNIKWKAGRTSSSLRSSAVLCLSYIVNRQLESVKVAGRSRILEGVLPLVEDDAQATRIFVCGIVGAVCSREDVDRVFKPLLGRLDDVCRDVRKAAMTALHDICRLPAPSEHVDSFRKSLAILVNDSDAYTRETARGILKLLRGQDEDGAPQELTPNFLLNNLSIST